MCAVLTSLPCAYGPADERAHGYSMKMKMKMKKDHASFSGGFFVSALQATRERSAVIA